MTTSAETVPGTPFYRRRWALITGGVLAALAFLGALAGVLSTDTEPAEEAAARERAEAAAPEQQRAPEHDPGTSETRRVGLEPGAESDSDSHMHAVRHSTGLSASAGGDRSHIPPPSPADQARPAPPDSSRPRPAPTTLATVSTERLDHPRRSAR